MRLIRGYYILEMSHVRYTCPIRFRFMPTHTNKSVSKSFAPIFILIGGGVLLLLAALIGLLLQNGLPISIGAARPQIGQKLADFAGEDLDGRAVRLSDYSGSPVLINFWATWCPPCVREMPGLNAFYQSHQSAGLVVLAINVGETREQAAAFSEKLGLQFPVLLDPEYELSDRMLVDNYPTSILVGRDGKVKIIHIGYFSAEALDRELTSLLE